MLWRINQATAGEISGQAKPPPAEKSGEKSGEEKKGLLSAGGGASFGSIKIDA
jgi:hypothetical protein